VKQENQPGSTVIIQLEIQLLSDNEVGATIENPIVVEDVDEEDVNDE